MPETFSKNIRNLIVRMVSTDILMRPTVDQILAMDFINNVDEDGGETLLLKSDNMIVKVTTGETSFKVTGESSAYLP